MPDDLDELYEVPNVLQFPRSECIFDRGIREEYHGGIHSYENPLFDFGNDEDLIDVSVMEARLIDYEEEE